MVSIRGSAPQITLALDQDACRNDGNLDWRAFCEVLLAMSSKWIML
jgi:hypothetical protein